MSLVSMLGEGFNSQLCSICIAPLAAALLCVVLTSEVESETHGNIARCCWEPWREGQLCVGCACVCLRFLHTPAAPLNAPFHQKARADGSEWLLPPPPSSPSTFSRSVCGNFSIVSKRTLHLHTYKRTNPGTILPTSNLMPLSFKDITLVLTLGAIPLVTALCFVASVVQFKTLSSF